MTRARRTIEKKMIDFLEGGKNYVYLGRRDVERLLHLPADSYLRAQLGPNATLDNLMKRLDEGQLLIQTLSERLRCAKQISDRDQELLHAAEVRLQAALTAQSEVHQANLAAEKAKADRHLLRIKQLEQELKHANKRAGRSE